MRRTLTLAGTWAAATTAAVGLAWAGVSIVSEQVSEPVRTVSAASPSVTPSPTPSSPAPSPSPSVASPSPMATAEATDEPSEAGGVAAPRGTAAPASPPSTSGAPAPGASPSPRPSASSTPSSAASAPAETRSYQLVGGTVTVRYSSTLVEVLVATPADGFEVEVERDGPTDVRVEFESDAHRSRLDAEWEGGAPRDRTREEPR